MKQTFLRSLTFAALAAAVALPLVVTDAVAQGHGGHHGSGVGISSGGAAAAGTAAADPIGRAEVSAVQSLKGGTDNEAGYGCLDRELTRSPSGSYWRNVRVC